MIFLAKNFMSLTLCGVALLVVVLLTKVPVRLYLKSLKPLLIIIIFTSILNILYVKSGVELFSIWKITVTLGGVATAIYMAARVSLLIIAGSILTYTTSATELTDGIERLLSPLSKLHVDVHSFAMMMTIALRFIPTLMEETDKIMSAQKARGADLETGGIKQRMKALLPIIIPLLVSSFRRAFELADAMECRCYHGGEGRTRFKKPKAKLKDYLSLVIFCVILAGVILSNKFLNGLIYSLITMII